MIRKKNLFIVGLVLLILMLPNAFAAIVAKSFIFNEPKISSVEIGDKKFDSISMEGLDSSAVPGEPRMPFRQVKLLIPFGAKITGIKVDTAQEKAIPGKYEVEISQKPIPLLTDDELIKKGYEKKILNIKSEIRKSVRYGSLYSKYSVQKMTGYNIVTVNLFPVVYNPQEGKLSYFTQMNVIINYEIPGIATSVMKQTTFRNLKQDKDKLAIVVDNPELVSAYTPRFSFREVNKPGTKQNPANIAGNAVEASVNEVNSDKLVQSSASENYDYIIITSKEFAEMTGNGTFIQLAEWKSSKGLKTKIISVEDIYSQYSGYDNQEKIRNFIKDAYLNWNIQYVLLGGDGDGESVGKESGDNIVPVRLLWVSSGGDIGWMTIASDVYYSNLDGNFDYNNNHVYGEPGDGENGQEVDLLAEVYVGRAPVDSAEEVSNFVKKTIQYESAVMSNASWLLNDLLVGEDLFWSTASIYMNEIRDGSSEYGYETQGLPETMNTGTLYDLVSWYGDERDYAWDKQELIDKINNDANSEYNHLGHASTCYVMKLCNAPESGGGYCSGEGYSDIDNLANENPFFSYSQGCYPGAFDNWNYEGMYTTCDSASEHFVLGTHGAFAAIMNSRYGWGNGYPSTDGPSQRHHRRFIDAIYGQRIANLGRANAFAKEGLIGYFSMDDYMRGIYWETNLIGDPETAMYLPPKPQHDLKMQRISVEGGIINKLSLITLSIKNLGKNEENASTVSVYINSEKINDYIIDFIGVDEIKNISFNYTFLTDGETMIEAKIINPLDENPANNKAAKTITVVSVSFTECFSDEGVDTNDNGLFDILRIKCGITSAMPKTVTITGELYGSWWEIDRINKEYEIDGAQDIDFDFNGMKIYLSENGPFYLKNLKVSDEKGILQDSIPEAYTTNYYSSLEFEPAKDIEINFNYDDTANRILGQKTRIGLTINNNQEDLDEPILLSFYEGLYSWDDDAFKNFRLISKKTIMPPTKYSSKYLELEWTPTEPGDRMLYAFANISQDMDFYNNGKYKAYYSAPPSRIVNTGDSAIKGYLLVKIQSPDGEWGEWIDREVIIDDIATNTKRIIASKTEFDIPSIIPGSGIIAKPYNCTQVFCEQRIYAALTAKNGKILSTEDGVPFEMTSTYYVYNKEAAISKKDIKKEFAEFKAAKVNE